MRQLPLALIVGSLAVSCQTGTDERSGPLVSLADLPSGELAVQSDALIAEPSPTPSPTPAPEATPEKSSKKASKDKKKSSSTAVASPVTPKTAAAAPASLKSVVVPNTDEYRNCKVPEVKSPSNTREGAYETAPFQPGEHSVYEVFYMGVLGGYGSIDVDNPMLVDGEWMRVVRGDASTGDWYKYVFVLKDKLLSVSRPIDYGIRRFYMEQDEGKLIGSRYVQKKWVEFDHANCKSHERTQRKGREEKIADYDFQRSSTDAIGAYFQLRSRNFQVGKKEYVNVYTSEKNWSLEAEPLGVESIETAAGKFNAMKLKLQTYIGNDLQQKGDVVMWIASDLPERVLIQIKADVKVGSIYVKLKEFKPGNKIQ
jgi:hypothetical protein